MLLKVLVDPRFLALLSLALSLGVFFVTYIKPPKIKFHVGERIAVWHSNSNIVFDIMLVIINTSNITTFVDNIYIEITQIGNNNLSHTLKWDSFLNFKEEVSGDPSSGKTWDDEPVFPFAVNKQKAVGEYISFNSSKIINWVPSPGKYKIVLKLEHIKKRKSKQVTEKVTFTINDDLYQKLKINKNTNTKTSTYIFIDKRH